MLSDGEREVRCCWHLITPEGVAEGLLVEDSVVLDRLLLDVGGAVLEWLAEVTDRELVEEEILLVEVRDWEIVADEALLVDMLLELDDAEDGPRALVLELPLEELGDTGKELDGVTVGWRDIAACRQLDSATGAEDNTWSRNTVNEIGSHTTLGGGCRSVELERNRPKAWENYSLSKL